MWARCALVSRTFGSTGVAEFSSDDDEQPASSPNASAAAIAQWRDALSNIGAHQLGAMPPAAAKRLEQRGGIGEAVGFGLDEAEPRLLVRLVGVEHRQIGGIAVLVLEAGEIETRLCGVRRLGRRVQCIGILL